MRSEPARLDGISLDFAGVAVKMHSPKKVLLCTYFWGNKYSLAYISQVKITPGIF